MSRSRKKNPIVGWAGHSEKVDKKAWHRRFRLWCKKLLRLGEETIDNNEHRNVSNPWSMSKDGKCYMQEPLEEYMRK